MTTAAAVALRASSTTTTTTPLPLAPRAQRLDAAKWRTATFGTDIASIDAAFVAQCGDAPQRVRARVVRAKATGKVGFVLLRQPGHVTLQAVVTGADALAAVKKLTPETIVDVTGTIVAAKSPVKSATCDGFELQATAVEVVSQAATPLPLDDRTAKLDTRLNVRPFDLRSEFNTAVFAISDAMVQSYRQYLASVGFREVQTPKILPTPSEGGASVFEVGYFGGKAYLAQSPQLYKQMVVMGDTPRVLEVGPVFRAENSNTHRHLTEFIGLDAEMVIDRSYTEVLDVLEAAVCHVLRHVEGTMGDAVATARRLAPSGAIEGLGPITVEVAAATRTELSLGCDERGEAGADKYGARVGSDGLPVLRLPFDGAMQLLVDGGAIEAALDDFNTAMEKQLGVLVRQRYGVDLVLVDRYPASARPFYTQRDPRDDTRTLSYDLLLRGEEICSGAQRLHDVALLAQRAQAAGVKEENIRPYLDCFAHGAWPHGGFGIGLQRLVMLYLGLPDVRYATLFPRDPTRVSP